MFGQVIKKNWQVFSYRSQYVFNRYTFGLLWALRVQRQAKNIRVLNLAFYTFRTLVGKVDRMYANFSISKYLTFFYVGNKSPKRKSKWKKSSQNNYSCSLHVYKHFINIFCKFFFIAILKDPDFLLPF